MKIDTVSIHEARSKRVPSCEAGKQRDHINVSVFFLQRKTLSLITIADVQTDGKIR